MALVGGGPGGPVGSSNSFTGKAQALEIVGDFAYAYNTLPAIDTDSTVFEFTTGNYIFVGQVQFTCAVDIDVVGNGLLGILTVYMGGSEMAFLKTDSVSEDTPATESYDLIIPPYTDVKVNVINDSDAPAFLNSIALTGRIHRG